MNWVQSSRVLVVSLGLVLAANASEASTILSVTATDDGLPLPPMLTYAWSTVLKPADATVRIVSSTSATTAAFFNRPGSYRFEVAISDGKLSATSAVNVTAVTGSSGGGSATSGGSATTGGTTTAIPKNKGDGGGGCGVGSGLGAIGLGLLLTGLRRRRQF